LSCRGAFALDDYKTILRLRKPQNLTARF
jgi:hypothetical protein